jgi:hypothetical protein
MEKLFAAIFIGFSVIMIAGLAVLAYLNWREQREETRKSNLARAQAAPT